MATGPDRGAQHLANALESLREDAAWPRACGPMAVARLLEAYDAQAARLAAMEQERDRLKSELARLRREHELAWAAGLFDGEGSFMLVHTNRPNRFPKARARLSMTDESIVRRLTAVLGVGTVTGPEHRERRKPMWVWQVSRYENVKLVVDAMWPWLCDTKREQATNALSGHHHGQGHGMRYYTPPAPRQDACRCETYRTALELIREMGQAWARGEWPERDAAVTRLQELANAG